MSSMMVAMVTLIVTCSISPAPRFSSCNGHGLHHRLADRAITGYVILPMARRFTDPL